MKVKVSEKVNKESGIGEFIGKVGTVAKVCKKYCWVSFPSGKTYFPKDGTHGQRYYFYPVEEQIKIKLKYDEMVEVKNGQNL